MGRFVFKLPDIGEGIAESEIAGWRVAVGDAVEEDQPLVDMLTDKAAVEIPSPVAGKVVECRGRAGDRIAVGAPLVVIETEATPAGAAENRSTSAAETAPAAMPSAAVAGTPAQPPPSPAQPAPMTSPAIRRRARERGVDLRAIVGSGPRGRITQADFDAHLAALGAPTPTAANSIEDRVEPVRIIGLRRKIAEAMQRSAQRIPHFAYVEETDVTELEALRAHLNATKRDDRPKLTLLPFLILALVRTLPRFPQINATYDDEAGIAYRHSAVHLGVATATPSGLVVPVIRNAQALDLWQLAGEIKRLSGAARDGRARREELSGSTITLTSLGALGGLVTTPIINAPEVAIVGVNRIVERPAIVRGAVVPRLTMNLSSSFDHRIVDGWDAAAFIQGVKGALEHPATLFMA